MNACMYINAHISTSGTQTHKHTQTHLSLTYLTTRHGRRHGPCLTLHRGNDVTCRPVTVTQTSRGGVLLYDSSQNPCRRFVWHNWREILSCICIYIYIYTCIVTQTSEERGSSSTTPLRIPVVILRVISISWLLCEISIGTNCHMFIQCSLQSSQDDVALSSSCAVQLAHTPVFMYTHIYIYVNVYRDSD